MKHRAAPMMPASLGTAENATFTPRLLASSVRRATSSLAGFRSMVPAAVRQLGVRQARYRGRAKTLFQLLMAAMVANLTLIAARTATLREGLGALMGSLRAALNRIGEYVLTWSPLGRTCVSPAAGGQMERGWVTQSPPA